MKPWFKHGWKLKLVSLGLAIGLWYFAVNEESVEITRMIPLSIEMNNDNMIIQKVSTEYLRVTIKVPRAMVGEVASADIRARHRFGDETQKAGEYSFHSDSREISLPSLAMSVIKIEPQTVTVVVDELVTEKFPVKPQFDGSPAFGYKVRDEELKLDPEAIMVQGPQSEISKMKTALTSPISLTGRTRSFRMTTEFDLPSSVTPVSADEVELFVPIHEVSEEKELRDVIVKMIRPSGALGVAELNPQKVTVTIQGPRRVLQNLEPEKMHAYADLSGLDYGEHPVDVAWVLAPGLTIKEDKKIQVTAVIRRNAK